MIDGTFEKEFLAVSSRPMLARLWAAAGPRSALLVSRLRSWPPPVGRGRPGLRRCRQGGMACDQEKMVPDGRLFLGSIFLEMMAIGSFYLTFRKVQAHKFSA